MHTPRRRFRLLQSFVVVATAVVVVVPMLVAGDPVRVQARSGYPCRYDAFSNRCKQGCASTAAIIKRCIQTQDVRGGLSQCRATVKGSVADCSGDLPCKRTAKRAYTSCKKQVSRTATHDRAQIKGRHGAARCASCCERTCGQSCQAYFGKSRWYGSYRRYDKVFCRRNDRPGPPPPVPGSPSGAFGGDYSDRIRARLGDLIPFLTRGWSR